VSRLEDREIARPDVQLADRLSVDGHFEPLITTQALVAVLALAVQPPAQVGDERLMELLQLARDQADERTPQHAGPDGAPEHGKGFTRGGGIRLGDGIQAVSLDERLVVVHCRRL
jgi:hypothetical protein